MSVFLLQYAQLVLAARRGQEMTGSGYTPPPVVPPPDPGDMATGSVFLDGSSVFFNNQYVVLS